jgi:hypothetical protein
MAIDIYDSAKIVKKGNVYYYFVKNGSKNCFTCPFQYVVDNNFRDKFIRGSSRESNWRLIAYGSQKEVIDDKIADTSWNCPTSYYYGEIRFGNKKNISLFFVKNKSKILDYNLLDSEQQKNIDNEIEYYLTELKGEYTIDLEYIEEKNRMKEIIYYCGEEYNLLNNYIDYKDKRYWDLDNL